MGAGAGVGGRRNGLTLMARAGYDPAPPLHFGSAWPRSRAISRPSFSRLIRATRPASTRSSNGCPRRVSTTARGSVRAAAATDPEVNFDSSFSPPTLYRLELVPKRIVDFLPNGVWRSRRARAARRALHAANRYFSSAVQCAHFVAFSGTADRQYGQSFVVGAAAGAGLCIRLICLMRRKIANAMIRKLMMLLRKIP